MPRDNEVSKVVAEFFLGDLPAVNRDPFVENTQLQETGKYSPWIVRLLPWVMTQYRHL